MRITNGLKYLVGKLSRRVLDGSGRQPRHPIICAESCLFLKKPADPLHVRGRRVKRQHAHHSNIFVIPRCPVRLVSFKDANLIVQGAKPIGILVGRPVINGPKLAHPQRDIVLLGEFRPFSFEEVALLSVQVPRLRAIRRGGSGMNLAGVSTRPEPWCSVVMRTVDKVVVKGLFESRELLCLVIPFKEDDVPGIDLANLIYKPPIKGIHALPVRLEI